jgi:hypothetical protein
VHNMPTGKTTPSAVMVWDPIPRAMPPPCGANDHNFGYVFTSFDEDYFNASRTVAMAWSKTGLLI